MSTKRDRAIRAMADKLDLRDETFGLGAALDAAMAIMAEPEPAAGGMVRVRLCVCVEPDREWFATGRSGMSDDEARLRVVPSNVRFQHRVDWIEADVPAYEPPAETTVNGRVVG